jgi:thioredoxin 1
MALELTKSNFDSEVIDAGKPAIVDFWATWCMPCRMVAPHVEELATEYAGKINVGKVDIDKEGDLAEKFGVMSIPSLLFFKGGRVVETIVGAVPKEHIIEKIKSVFGEV